MPRPHRSPRLFRGDLEAGSEVVRTDHVETPDTVNPHYSSLALPLASKAAEARRHSVAHWYLVLFCCEEQQWHADVDGSISPDDLEHGQADSSEVAV